MDVESISKQSKGNVDQSLLKGTGSGGMLSTGYFKDKSLINRLHDGERVEYALQNLSKGITVGNEDSADTIIPHSSYRTVLLVTDERLLYVVGQKAGDKTFSVWFKHIQDVEVSHGVLKDRIVVQTDGETYDMYTRKGGSLEEASRHISELSEKKAKKSNEFVNEQLERTNKEATDNNADKYPDRPEQDTNVLSRSGCNTNSKGNPSNLNSNVSVTTEILVSNIDGEPVPNASVKIAGTALSVDGRTSQTGRCSISTSEAPESVKMEINHPQYQTIQEEMTLACGAVIDITLKSADSTEIHSEKMSQSDGTNSTKTSDTSNGSPERTELLDELVALNERFSRKVTRGRMRTDGKYSPEDYEAAFGSWSTAIDRAPFDRTNESSSAQPNQQTYSRQEVIDALVDLMDKVDGRPSTSDMNELGGMSASPVYQYFKSWDTAVDAVKEEHSAVELDQDGDPFEESADDSNMDSPAKNTTAEQTEMRDLPADRWDAEIKSGEFAELSGFRRDLLVVINGLDAPKGLDIKRELEEYYDGTIHHGRLYPNLDTLVEAGFIEKSAQDERSNRYELTEFGANHIEARYHWQQNRAATNENQTRTPGPEDRTTSESTKDDTPSKKEQRDNTHTENIPHHSTTEDGRGDSNSELTEEDEEDGPVSGESEREHDIGQLIGVGGATKADAEALMESGYMMTSDLESASLDDLRSVSGLDDGTALRIKAELG